MVLGTLVVAPSGFDLVGLVDFLLCPPLDGPTGGTHGRRLVTDEAEELAVMAGHYLLYKHGD